MSPTEEKGVAIILDDPNQGVKFSQSKGWREQLRQHLSTHTWQWTIIVLVIIDAMLVGTDIILSSVYCNDHPPDAVEDTENWLRIGSITILSFFVLEWLVEAWVHGFHRWVRTYIHGFDLAIVVISLALEFLALVKHEAGLELGGLLVVFRLWRVVRVMHAVQEIQHKRAHEEISSLREANDELHDIKKAHHEIVKGLHSEFVQRLNATRSARLEQLCADCTEEQPVLTEAHPSLEDLLTSVSKHGHNISESVKMHRRSLHMPSGPSNDV